MMIAGWALESPRGPTHVRHELLRTKANSRGPESGIVEAEEVVDSKPIEEKLALADFDSLLKRGSHRVLVVPFQRVVTHSDVGGDPIMNEASARAQIGRGILTLGIGIALIAGTAAGQPAGSDHVVRPCPAQPYTKANFYTSGMAPVDVLKALKAAGQADAAAAYLVHIAEWTDSPAPPGMASTAVALQQRMTRSEWAGFNYKGEPKPVKTDSNGNPILFNKTSTALIGVSHFSRPIPLSTVMVGYGYSTTPSPKQNLADLVALLNALAGAAGVGGGGGGGGEAKAPVVPPDLALYVTSCKILQDAPLPLSINLTYTVTPVAPPAVQVSSTSLDFGTVAPGSPKAMTVTLTNHQATALAFAATPAAIMGPNASEFSISAKTCAATLAVNASCDFTLQFQPAGVGAKTATLAIANDAPKSPQAVGLTGTGAAAAPPAAGNTPPAAGGGKPAKPNAQNAATTTPNNQTSQGTTTPAQSGSTPTDCTAVTSDAPCTVTRNVVDYDREYWDIGLGLAIPGVPERMYNPSDLAQHSTTTLHTDVYAFVDVYLNGNRNSYWPHLAFGVPTASQPLHRQAYTMAFPLTTWFGLNQKVPFTLSAVLGVVAEKEYHLIPDPMGNNGLALKAGWTAKWFYGVELPLNQLISRVSKIGK